MVDQNLTKYRRHITSNEEYQVSQLQGEIDNFHGKSFRWKNDHPLVNTQVKNLYKLSTKKKQQKDNQEEEEHGEKTIPSTI